MSFIKNLRAYWLTSPPTGAGPLVNRFKVDKTMWSSRWYEAVRSGDTAGVDLSGSTGHYISTPDAAVFDLTGDLCLAFRGVCDWSTGIAMALVGKYDTGQRSYRLTKSTSGLLQVQMSNNGTTTTSKLSSTAVPFSDGDDGYVAFTYDASAGSGKFWTSTDGSSWAQLGTAVTGLPTSLHSGTAAVEVGTVNSGTGQPFTGSVRGAWIYSGIGADTAPGQGTLLAAPDFISYSAGSFDDAQGNTWTVNVP